MLSSECLVTKAKSKSIKLGRKCASAVMYLSCTSGKLARCCPQFVENDSEAAENDGNSPVEQGHGACSFVFKIE